MNTFIMYVLNYFSPTIAVSHNAIFMLSC